MRPKIFFARVTAKLGGIFGHGQVVSIGVILLLALGISVAILASTNFAAPTHMTIVSGPKGSVFERNAQKYKKLLAKEGVELTVLPSTGSLDNLEMLTSPKKKVDVGFVLGGEITTADTSDLMSLGSVSYQPLMVFYRGAPKKLLSDFNGMRVDIGVEGSGTHALALALLKSNGIEPGGATTFLHTAPEDVVDALVQDRVDVIFLMGDSTASDLLRKLLHAPDIHLFNFSQADGYTRRIGYLNKLILPKGSLDFGKDIPAEDTALIGPTVEILARSGLHPALSDLFLDAVREVHKPSGLFKKRGEFPAPQEHEFRISPDASRYYASGKSFLYRTFPFGIASVITRIVTFVLPLALLLIPALKLAPAIYRWRIESRIHRWYRALLDLERDAFHPEGDARRRDALLQQLDHIEDKVSKIVIPAAFGDLFYGLRGHIQFVRTTLKAQHAPAPIAFATGVDVDANDDGTAL